MRVLVCLALAAIAGAAEAAEQPATRPGRLEFEVLRQGDKPFGAHAITVRREGDGVLAVEDVTHYEVKAGPFTVYRYDRRCEERWREGRLVSFDCTTKDGGRTIVVAGVAGPEGLSIEAPKGGASYPPGAQHFAPWNLAYARAPLLIDTETGKPMEGGAREVEPAPFQLGARTLRARRFRVEGSIGGYAFYDAEGRWVGLEFKGGGQKIRYVLRSPLEEAPR